LTNAAPDRLGGFDKVAARREAEPDFVAHIQEEPLELCPNRGLPPRQSCSGLDDERMLMVSAFAK
jgi:hypothetical protein